MTFGRIRLQISSKLFSTAHGKLGLHDEAPLGRQPSARGSASCVLSNELNERCEAWSPLTRLRISNCSAVYYLDWWIICECIGRSFDWMASIARPGESSQNYPRRQCIVPANQSHGTAAVNVPIQAWNATRMRLAIFYTHPLHQPLGYHWDNSFLDHRVDEVLYSPSIRASCNGKWITKKKKKKKKEKKICWNGCILGNGIHWIFFWVPFIMTLGQDVSVSIASIASS